MVLGTPMMGMPFLARPAAILREPSPPTAMRPSRPRRWKFETAWSETSTKRSWPPSTTRMASGLPRLLVPRMEPPRWVIPRTDSVVRGPGRGGARSLEQGQHGLEGGAVAPAEQLVDGHLGAGEDGARALHAVEADLPVLLRARPHRVPRHVHLVAALEGAEHDLGHADVRLDPRHQKLVA